MQVADGTKESGFAMRTEDVLRRVAIGCAIFLLFGPLGGRTSVKDGGTTVTVAAAYNMAALFSGTVALVALGGALWTRPRLILPLLGAVVAITAFGLTAFVAGLDGLARTRGEVYLYGVSEFARVTAKIHPSVGPPFFALAAATGAVTTLALAVSWLRQP
jgi:hypothetical protein